MQAELVRLTPFAGTEEWVTYRFRDDEGLRHAEWLLCLRRDHLGGSSEGDLLDRVAKVSQAE